MLAAAAALFFFAWLTLWGIVAVRASRNHNRSFCNYTKGAGGTFASPALERRRPGKMD